MFVRRFCGHLVGRQGRGWLKIVGATGFMFVFGIVVGLYMVGRNDALQGAAAAGAVTMMVLLSTIFGAVAGTLLVARDVVKLQLEEGDHVNLLLRLVLASGIVSLLIWVVGAFGGAIVLTMLLIYMDTGSLSGSGNVAANTPTTGGNASRVTPDPSISEVDTPAPPSDRPIPPPIVPPVIPPVVPTGGTSPAIDAPEETPAAENPLENSSEPSPPKFIEPLIIGPEVPAKDAYAQFVERYGAERVARVVVRMTSESPAVEARLHGELMRQVEVGTVPSIYVSVQKTTVAGIVAPIDSLAALTDDFEFGEVTQVRENDRIVMVTFADAVASTSRPPQEEPDTSTEQPAANGDPLAQLLAQFDGGDLRARRDAADAIAAFKTPQAAKALAERLSGTDRLAVSEALVSMGDVAHPAVLALAESEDFATSSAAFSILQESGTKKLLPKLQRLARHQDRRIAAQAKMTIAAIGRQP